MMLDLLHGLDALSLAVILVPVCIGAAAVLSAGAFVITLARNSR